MRMKPASYFNSNLAISLSMERSFYFMSNPAICLRLNRVSYFNSNLAIFTNGMIIVFQV